ncbi:putative structural constituent of cell wall protein, partial [Trifolium medium]|nr:putative structural constituent of cell wall protein [Trifolium medium]
SGVHTTPPPASAYMMHEGEGGRANYPPQPSQSAQGGYPPQSASLQNPALHNLPVRNPSQPQLVRSHPYNELIENLVNMGVRGDLVVSIIQSMSCMSMTMSNVV